MAMNRTMLFAKGMAVLAILAFASGFQFNDSIVMEGMAMLPSFKDGQRVKVQRFDRSEKPDVKRGDVVVFLFPDDPSKLYIKRLIGLPGDVIEIREGKVLVNNKELKEPYVDSRFNRYHRSQAPTAVRAHYFYVLGDNRDNSNDSRIWGLVPERYVYAKVISPQSSDVKIVAHPSATRYDVPRSVPAERSCLYPPTLPSPITEFWPKSDQVEWVTFTRRQILDLIAR